MQEKRRPHGGRVILGSAIGVALAAAAVPAALAAYATDSVEPAAWAAAGAPAIAAKVSACVHLEGASAVLGCPAIDRARAPEGTLVELPPVRRRVTVTVTVQDPPPPTPVPFAPPAWQVPIARPAAPLAQPAPPLEQEQEHEDGGHDD